MKISLLIVLLSYAFSSNTYYKMVEVEYNERYTVRVSDWGSYIPSGLTYYFILSCEPDDEMEVRLTVIHTAYAYFDVDVCAYTRYPDERYIIENQNYCGVPLPLERIDQDNNYDEYIYPFTTGVNVQYIAIKLDINEPLHYLSIYIYSSKGMALAILLVIIFLPCIVVAAVVVYFLRRFGCIRIGVSSNMI